MQAHYDAAFTREMGLTAAEFWRCWPQAIGHAAFALEGSPESTAQTRVNLASGQARIAWQLLPPRVIALATLPRLHVAFDFNTVDATERQRFMKYFDLVMLRGGG